MKIQNTHYHLYGWQASQHVIWREIRTQEGIPRYGKDKFLGRTSGVLRLEFSNLPIAISAQRPSEQRPRFVALPRDITISIDTAVFCYR